MTSRRQSSVRQHTFSLYNLSANEIYFEDYAVDCESSLKDFEQMKIKGRLKICSKSLVFVPNDIRSPMIKILYKQILKFEDGRKNELSLTASTIVSTPLSPTKTTSNCLILICSSVTLMSIGGRIEPYTTLYEKHRFSFEFFYTSVEDCLSVVGQLYRSTTLLYPDQVMMVESIVQGRLKMLKFDLKQLKDLNERILFEEDAYVIKPLIQNPGKCLLTDQCCYFQALNNINEQRIVKYDLHTLCKIRKRRYKFRYIGCELQFNLTDLRTNQSKILYLVFANESLCSRFYDLVRTQTSVQVDSTSFENMTLRWQQGTISNYDYLLYLNDRAERSFHDCSQYPVFPWVLRNYTAVNLDLNDPQTFRDLSKPIGALNIERLERLKERYINMSLPSDSHRFLYGSFYSNPGFLVYFLCRLYPQFSLCLNDGRFDHPDRLFHSLIDTWKSVLTSDSDVKELIPEFYMSSKFDDVENGNDDEEHRHDGEFLINQFTIDFGIRHDDVSVGDVILPPWAENPNDFIYKMRQALESDYVSQHLHQWIDLIFGYKQRGEEARAADNLFHYLTYGVPENQISKSADEFNEYLSLETQILEFGQVPKQLFFKPHPRKLTKKELDDCSEQEKNANTSISLTPIDTPIDPIESNPIRPRIQSLSSFEEHELGQFEFDSICRLHKTAVTRIIPHPLLSTTHLLTIGDDGFLRNYIVDSSKNDAYFYVSSRPLTCLKSIPVRLSIDTNEQCSLAFIGGYDHTLYIYNLDTGTSILSQILHDDVITDLYVTNRSTPALLCTSSSDATVRFWSLENLLIMDEEKYVFTSDSHRSFMLFMQYDISFDSSCTCMNVLEEHSLLSVGCQDGSVYLCHFQTGQILKQLASLSTPILSVSFRIDGRFLAYLSATTITLVDIISGTDVFTNTCLSNDQLFNCLFYSSQMLIVGLINGSCDVWNLKICEKVYTLNICDNLPITTIAHNHGMFFFGNNDGSVHSYVFASRLQLSV
ncbi:hypothetical protein I4U23_018392 [Adineta vaga]|nr:hypothetical protein I4U23_018392 [Adineta vaga]